MDCGGYMAIQIRLKAGQPSPTSWAQGLDMLWAPVDLGLRNIFDTPITISNAKCKAPFNSCHHAECARVLCYYVKNLDPIHALSFLLYEQKHLLTLAWLNVECPKNMAPLILKSVIEKKIEP